MMSTPQRLMATGRARKMVRRTWSPSVCAGGMGSGRATVALMAQQATGTEAHDAQQISMTAPPFAAVSKRQRRRGRGIDRPEVDPYVPPSVAPARMPEARYESRQLVEIGQETAQGLPHHPAQGPRLRHQQDQPPLQGPPGLAQTHLANL